jgi:hypothetical protein
MKNKITYLNITIPANRPAYVGIHRGGKVTTIGQRVSGKRLCLIASLANKIMVDVGVMAFSKEYNGT